MNIDKEGELGACLCFCVLVSGGGDGLLVLMWSNFDFREFVVCVVGAGRFGVAGLC